MSQRTIEVQGDQPQRLAVAFARVLRGAGLDVPGGAPARFAQALGLLGLDEETHVYWAGRATLVRRPEDVDAYDAAFRVFWLGVQDATGGAGATETEIEQLVLVADEDSDPMRSDLGDDGDDPEKVLELRYSAREVLSQKDFALCSPEELAEAQRLMAMLRWAAPRRSTRRRRPARRRGDRPDLRRTVRHALRTGGEPMRRHWLEPGTRERRVLFVCDVSGSMSPYARALLRFLHVAVAGRPGVEAFTVGTRLTRVTRALCDHDPDAALAAAARAVPDWSGGTRLGEALRELNDRWGARGFARGAVVVILSDGWDRGDPAQLGQEMARLARAAHRIVWVNPLMASPGFAPLARGMAAALPYVDQLMEGHSVASLESLVRALEETPGPAPVRHEPVVPRARQEAPR